MKERDQLKNNAVDLGNIQDWLAYHCLRNKVTKLNKQKKGHYQSRIEEIKYDSKKFWSMLNKIMGKDKMEKST